MRNNLKGVRRIKVIDSHDYEEGKHNDGGHYLFWTNYERVSDDTWEVSYGTSADMDYCPVCGCFEDHYDHETNDYHCGDYETITEAEVLQRIKEEPDTEVTFTYEDDCEFLKKEDITGWHGDVFDHPSYKTTCELDGKEIIPVIHCKRCRKRDEAYVQGRDI